VTTTELRRDFHDRMAHVHRKLGSVVTSVAASVESVTEFLTGASDAPAVVDDASVDAAYAWLEEEIFDLVALQAPVGRDLRFLTASLRIGQAIERAGDLVSSIAFRSELLRPYASTPLLSTTIRDLGTGGAGMLRGAASAYAVLDASLAEEVAARDDDIDELHRGLVRTVYGMEGLGLEPAVELGLVGRFYERIGDHAVVIAERVRFIATSEMNPGDSDESEGWSAEERDQP
jgi:phosphate transport system protein